MQDFPERPASGHPDPGRLDLETTRWRLRPPRHDDAEALVRLMTPAISRWVATWPVPFTLELAQARINGALAAIGGGNALIYALEHRGTLVGWIGGARLADHRASLGYWLGKPCHGQALMQEAAPAFVSALRVRLALESIEAACHPGNHASAPVLAACGLQRIGARWDYAPARSRDELVEIWGTPGLARRNVPAYPTDYVKPGQSVKDYLPK